MALYPDRVITIKGCLQGMSAAESALSQKLRECFDKELNSGYHNGAGGGAGGGGGAGNNSNGAGGNAGNNGAANNAGGSATPGGHLGGQHPGHHVYAGQMPMAGGMSSYSSFNGVGYLSLSLCLHPSHSLTPLFSLSASLSLPLCFYLPTPPHLNSTSPILIPLAPIQTSLPPSKPHFPHANPISPF